MPIPSLPTNSPVKKRRSPIYNYRKKNIPIKSITNDSTDIIANEIAKRNLTPHQRKRNDYDETGRLNIYTLAKVINHNQSQEVHDNIMNNHIDISYVNLYYGNKEVRVESNGSIMAIVLYCRNIPKLFTSPTGWKSVIGRNKIVLYTAGNNLISGNETLFRYNTGFGILKVEVIGAEEVLHYANIGIEGVDYWEYLKGNWETMTSVHWENFKGTF
tara:strand:- start:563 stop:1207 length:645 start_codon:yes stop_codon:yes gene_type:complete